MAPRSSSPDERAPARGALVLAATPIGRMEDAPARLADELAGADIVAAEDTRRLPKAGRRARRRRPRQHRVLLRRQRGRPHADPAGGPPRRQAGGPGHRRGHALRVRPRLPARRRGGRRGLTVTAVPGPSAVLTALAVSGLRSTGSASRVSCRARRGSFPSLAGLAGEPRTMVFFEAPHRTHVTLTAMAEAFGPERPVAVCRELTKTYEEVRRGSPGGARRLGRRRCPRRGHDRRRRCAVGPDRRSGSGGAARRGGGRRGRRSQPQGRDRLRGPRRGALEREVYNLVHAAG